MQETSDRADTALTIKQRKALLALYNKDSEAFSASAKHLGRTNLIYQSTDIGKSGPCVKTLNAFLTRNRSAQSRGRRTGKRWYGEAFVFTMCEPHYSGHNGKRRLTSLHRLP